MTDNAYIIPTLLFLIAFCMTALLVLRLRGCGQTAEPFEDKLLNGWMVMIYDGGNTQTTDGNKVFELLEKNSTPTEIQDIRLYKIDDTHTIRLVALNLANETAAAGIEPYFPNGMGLYIYGGSGPNDVGKSASLYLNNDFGASRISTADEASKFLRVFFHAKSQKELIDRVAEEFGLYVTQYDDTTLMEHVLWKRVSS